MRSWSCWLIGHRWMPLGVSPVAEVAVNTMLHGYTWWIRSDTSDPRIGRGNRECTRPRCRRRDLTLDNALLAWANATARLRKQTNNPFAWAPTPRQIGLSMHVPRQRG